MNDRHDYTPVALYARVSSDRQDVDNSVAAQLRALRDYAEKNGYMVVGEYIDEAESGRVADRPEFRKMLDEAAKPKAPFKEILVWKFSRFTRKREHAVAFKSMLRRKGIRVVSITEQAEDTATGRLLEASSRAWTSSTARTWPGGLAGHERGCFSRLLGRQQGPYGYNRVMVQDGVKKRPTLELDPDTAPIVKRIFDMSEAGTGMVDITRALNDDGIASPGAKLWGKTGVHKVLTNEAYTGTLIWGVSAKDGADPVRVEKAFPAIVTRTQFQRVGRQLATAPPRLDTPEGWEAPSCSAGWSSARRAGAHSPAGTPRAASSPTTSASPL